MTDYPFRLLATATEAPAPVAEALCQRPLPAGSPLAANASRFVADDLLLASVNAAIALGQPLLLTGEAGSGKTQLAYYVAERLGLGPVLHFQVKSDSRAKDLLYDFDAVRYFYDAQIQRQGELSKAKYISPRPLWQALAAKQPKVLLIDEIDKAPRDFPNDLLYELETMEFQITELGKNYSAPPQRRPLVFVTSNSERGLPEPFLRRCVYHHLRLDPQRLEQVVFNHQADFAKLSPGFIKIALERFLALREQPLRKPPSTGELLAWLRTLALAAGTYREPLDTDPAKLPYLGVLLKYREDLEQLGAA